MEETIGEDTYLVGVMVTSYVKGLQGERLNDGVIATLKYFAGYSSSEGGRNFAPAHVGRREVTDFRMMRRSGNPSRERSRFMVIAGKENTRFVLGQTVVAPVVPCCAIPLGVSYTLWIWFMVTPWLAWCSTWLLILAYRSRCPRSTSCTRSLPQCGQWCDAIMTSAFFP